jgi:hypothetical protein
MQAVGGQRHKIMAVAVLLTVLTLGFTLAAGRAQAPTSSALGGHQVALNKWSGELGEPERCSTCSLPGKAGRWHRHAPVGLRRCLPHYGDRNGKL